MIGTVVGAVAIVVLTARFPQAGPVFCSALALWGAACGFVATLLRNFAAMARRWPVFTAAVIRSDEIGRGRRPITTSLCCCCSRKRICIGIICAASYCKHRFWRRAAPAGRQLRW